MTQLSLTTTGGLQPQQWLDAAGLAAADANPRLQGWLTWPGLLTEAIRRRCAADFRLEVLQQTPCRFSRSERELLDVRYGTGLRREVLMRAAGTVLLYAETLIPEATLGAHPWLGALGDAPLGERLRGAVAESRRESLWFRRVMPGDPLLRGLRPRPSEPVWARRALHRIDGQPLAVTEVFLPQLLELPSP